MLCYQGLNCTLSKTSGLLKGLRMVASALWRSEARRVVPWLRPCTSRRRSQGPFITWALSKWQKMIKNNEFWPKVMMLLFSANFTPPPSIWQVYEYQLCRQLSGRPIYGLFTATFPNPKRGIHRLFNNQRFINNNQLDTNSLFSCSEVGLLLVQTSAVSRAAITVGSSCLW